MVCYLLTFYHLLSENLRKTHDVDSSKDEKHVSTTDGDLPEKILDRDDPGTTKRSVAIANEAVVLGKQSPKKKKKKAKAKKLKVGDSLMG